jgi:hypothetical protein
VQRKKSVAAEKACLRNVVASIAAAVFERRARRARLEGAVSARDVDVVLLRGIASVRGFMFAQPSQRVLFFPGVSEVHMAFVPAPIDVWFLRQEGAGYRVIERRRLHPWQFARVRGAQAVLEAWPGLPEFDRLRWQ